MKISTPLLLDEDEEEDRKEARRHQREFLDAIGAGAALCIAIVVGALIIGSKWGFM